MVLVNALQIIYVPTLLCIALLEQPLPGKQETFGALYRGRDNLFFVFRNYTIEVITAKTTSYPKFQMTMFGSSVPVKARILTDYGFRTKVTETIQRKGKTDGKSFIFQDEKWPPFFEKKVIASQALMVIYGTIEKKPLDKSQVRLSRKKRILDGLGKALGIKLCLGNFGINCAPDNTAETSGQSKEEIDAAIETANEKTKEAIRDYEKGVAQRFDKVLETVKLAQAGVNFAKSMANKTTKAVARTREALAMFVNQTIEYRDSSEGAVKDLSKALELQAVQTNVMVLGLAIRSTINEMSADAIGAPDGSWIEEYRPMELGFNRGQTYSIRRIHRNSEQLRINMELLGNSLATIAQTSTATIVALNRSLGATSDVINATEEGLVDVGALVEKAQNNTLDVMKVRSAVLHITAWLPSLFEFCVGISSVVLGSLQLVSKARGGGISIVATFKQSGGGAPLLEVAVIVIGAGGIANAITRLTTLF